MINEGVSFNRLHDDILLLHVRPINIVTVKFASGINTDKFNSTKKTQIKSVTLEC